ncbi:heavy metal translocating P-type ATPase [Marinagarivorans algicola]|uniref:heavy metal translocating P-type ATPase n=1 Tax=Marinagarivorans algicola TaxID=1513270 RepID=UPI0009E94909|nr:heavy metal translocating P-type ATPase [Marinagarivorans algicola]
MPITASKKVLNNVSASSVISAQPSIAQGSQRHPSVTFTERSSASTPPCFHCALPSVAGFSALIDGQEQPFCCAGCQAIAMAIVDGGLQNYYQYREQQGVKPEATQVQRAAFEAYDLLEVQEDFVVTDLQQPALLQAAITVEGITCTACVWLIEQHIKKLTGVASVSVNSGSHQGVIRFDPKHIKLSKIFAEFARIGFQLNPNTARNYQNDWQQRQRKAILRLGVAGLGMMQAGMVAIALHAGTIQGIEAHLQSLLRWASLIMATPVLLYSGYPFFIAAWRALKMRHLIMDVPVALALILAYVASAIATVNQTGDVYFDSIAMFTFFLLLGRFLEQRVRFNNFLRTGNLQQLVPLTALKKDSGYAQNDTCEPQRVPVKSLKEGDHIWIGSGETFPCDGRVEQGHSSADEALLTGEAEPQHKVVGSYVVAGSQNIESGLWVSVEAIGRQTRLAHIERLVDQAAAERPKQVAIADYIAGYFVAAVLIVSICVAGFWFTQEPAKALWITLSVLVVTCPCALSLATPTALTSALSAVRKKGVLMTSGVAMEQFGHITDVIFDKTGTLTCGQLHIAEVKLLDDAGPSGALMQADVLAIAAALQQVSSHPIAKAFRHIATPYTVICAKNITAQGVQGVIDGNTYRLGRLSFVCEHTTQTYPGPGQWLALAKNTQLIAWICLKDQVRDTSASAVQQLLNRGLQVHLLSGDRAPNVTQLQHSLGIKIALSEQTPANKLAYVQSLQAAGRKVFMVGDGINDVPVLAAADVSCAMGEASELARLQADSILLNNDLNQLVSLIPHSQRVTRIIKQNLAWALGYNLVALPLAAAGFVPPWMAAIGMSASSLIVVLNALRLARD